MRESITLYTGNFGRLAVMMGVKGWVTHVHRAVAIVVWLEGETGDITIGRDKVRPSRGVAVGINALQPHSHEIPRGAEPGKLIAFYLEPNWLWRRYGIDATVPFFADPAIAVTEGLREKVVQLVDRLTLPQAERGDCLASTEELIDEMVAAVRTGNRPAERADYGQRAVDPRIHRVIDLMRENVSRRICFDHLAAEAGLSRPHFFALFKEKTDVTPNVYWNMLRVNEACRMLHQAGHKMYALAADLGFTNEGNFSRFFRCHVGVSPLVYRSAVTGLGTAERDADALVVGEAGSTRWIREIELEIDRLKDEVARLRDREFAAADHDGAAATPARRLLRN
jgi:AraC family transcriptional regulator